MPAVRATILQISDLHYGVAIDPALETRVQGIAADVEPDILIASGDLIDSPDSQNRRNAAAFLVSVCAAINRRRGLKKAPPVELLVIPGNHDYKAILGSVETGPWDRHDFDKSFLEARPWTNGLLVHERHDLGLAIAGFNSNPPYFEWSAAGKVEAEALQELDNRFRDDGPLGEASPVFRIAVVHHHPLPIVFTSTARAARLEERHMVFYNAGTFLWSLNRKGFHLVLHGHKHFASLQRVGHDFADRGRRELLVAGAGSALHPKPDDPRGNHLQVIRTYVDGTATLDSWFFSAEVRRKDDESRLHSIIDLADVARWRRRVFRSQTNLAVGELRSDVRITEDGYAVYKDQFLHCRPAPGSERDSYQVDLSVPAPSYIRRVELLPIDQSPPLAELKKDPAAGQLRQYRGRIEFGRTYNEVCPPFSLAYQYRLMNSHALSYGEFQRKYKDQPYEYVSLPCYEPADALTLVVEFPAACPVDRLRYDVTVLFKPGTMKTIDDYGESDLAPHPEETARARRRLYRDGSRLILACCEPIPGYVYQLQWKFPEDPARTWKWDELLYANEKKLRLLEIRAGAVKQEPSARDLYAGISRTLEGLEADVKTKLKASPGNLELSLLAFDEDPKVKALRLVGANFGDLRDLQKIQFASGEGCAGFVFEKNRPQFYAAVPGHDTELYIAPGEGPEFAAFPVYKYLTTMPWLHPSGLMVGVICAGAVGARPPGDPVFGPEPEKIQQLWDLLLPCANGILESV